MQRSRVSGVPTCGDQAALPSCSARAAETLHLTPGPKLLVPRWGALHRTWPDPVPDPPSRFMCRYTAELVALLDPGWIPVLGLVNGSTHVWNERADGMFCDLTGDQLGRATVQLRLGRPPGYVPHRWTDTDSVAYRVRAAEWLRELRAEPNSRSPR